MGAAAFVTGTHQLYKTNEEGVKTRRKLIESGSVLGGVQVSINSKKWTAKKVHATVFIEGSQDTSAFQSVN